MELPGDETECGVMECEMERSKKKVVAMANEMLKERKGRMRRKRGETNKEREKKVPKSVDNTDQKKRVEFEVEPREQGEK